jgi:argininosuccinate lyase
MSEPEPLGVGARLGRGPSATLAAGAFSRELEAAPYLLTGLSLADMAHVAMLGDGGVIEPDTLAVLLSGLLELHPGAADIPLDPAVGDLYNNRDAYLRAKLGDLAGVIHTGRARREATTLAWQIAVRQRLLDLGLALAGFGGALAGSARGHRSTLMPDFTYLQHAQATTLGHYLLGFAYPVVRDLDRARRALSLVDRSPAGSGSVNGSQIPMDRDWVADLLEFEGVVEHTRDAMWGPDLAVEPMSVAVTVMTTIDRLAEDLQVFATDEFGFVELDDAHSRTSVIMPQKKNPYALAALRGEARRTLGTWTEVAASGLTPSGQPDNRIAAYSVVPLTLERTRAATDLAADVVRLASWDTARMEEAAAAGYTAATDICDHLVLTTGIDNRTAHRVVGKAVRFALDDGGAPLDATRIRSAAEALGVPLGGLDDAALERNLSPSHTVAARLGRGAAGPEPMATMLGDLDGRLSEARSFWEGHRLRGFHDRFLARIRVIVEHTRTSP